MDKNAIKRFAVEARKALIEGVRTKALWFDIVDGKTLDPDALSVNGRILEKKEFQQRRALIAQIQEKGYQQVIEEIAYTWFNRFSALRFMEVNGYLPVRVFTDQNNAFKPQILAEVNYLDLERLDTQKVFQLQNESRTDELYKYLLITLCNQLSGPLPGMFQKIEDYTELLFPDYLLRQDSVLARMVEAIPEEDWKDAVQIIGWLYQYYNSEKKDEVFANLKKNIKITRENIPAATQLFTPDWIVRYMVENSLGRLWLEGHDGDEIQNSWKYYLPEAEQEPEVAAQLEQLRHEAQWLDPMTLRCIDPCAGSGHILVYMFDVLMQIYQRSGYTTRAAVASILRHNLYGLDIDNRAAQLAYFSVMMKARQYDTGFLRHPVQPHVYAICDSHDIPDTTLDDFAAGDAGLKFALQTVIAELHDAKDYGSILRVTPQNWEALYARLDAIESDETNECYEVATGQLRPLVRVAEVLSLQYDVVVTNPPYMGGSGMNPKLSDFVKKHYPDSKSDLSTVMMEKSLEMCRDRGYMAMINIPAWMFLSNFEKLRHALITQNTITSMVHPGRGIFGSDFGTTTFVIGKTHIPQYAGSYRRLFNKQGEVETVEEREQRFFEKRGVFAAKQDDFTKIPGAPVAYWASGNIFSIFSSAPNIDQNAQVKIGMGTGKNEIFVREWWEVPFEKIDFSLRSITDLEKSTRKYFPYNKGGDYRLWYGNLSEVLWFDKDGRDFMNTMSGHRENGGYKFYCRHGLTWSFVSSSKFGVRYLPYGCFFDVAGSTLFTNDEHLDYILGFLCSKTCDYILRMLNPTINYQAGNIKSLPLIFEKIDEVNSLVQANISLSREDWDSFETSWDFQRHPLVRGVATVSEAYRLWERECETRFLQLKANEEELNRIFIEIYGLQDELTPEVDDRDVTVRRADLSREVRSLISYAVGCFFGRYSLDEPGLIYAGGEWNPSRYQTIEVDADAILPICDDSYLQDDIVDRFVDFLRVVYGSETLEENLQFVADALGGKGSSREVIRRYFLNDFYADHCRIYQKRPIYWQFDAGKKGSFRALVYIHRYQYNTIAQLRTRYVHEIQGRYDSTLALLEPQLANASPSERVKLLKRQQALKAQADEIHAYEEKIHHLADQMITLDLDAGVKQNYAIFEDVLAKIK